MLPLSHQVKQPKLVARTFALKRLVVGSIAILVLAVWLKNLLPQHLHLDPIFGVNLPPLVMQGGDPYIRALMRTISASEANSPRPYSILYGGQHVRDLSRHPEQCVTIVSGPNTGNCSTAAGRYQLLNTTWYSLAQRYHPQPSRFLFWESYSFEPKFQDRVVYAWLNDPQAWGTDLSKLLQQEKLDQVLRRLSGTWTSLGYGIEDNAMTGSLPQIYQKMLREELKSAGQSRISLITAH